MIRTFGNGHNINPAEIGSLDDDELDLAIIGLESSIFGQCFAAEVIFQRPKDLASKLLFKRLKFI